MQAEFKSLTVVNHPLVQHKLTIMRKTDTKTSQFRQLLKEISMLMGYEITRDFTLKTATIETPLGVMNNAPILSTADPVIVPILRAGIGMSDGLLDLMPTAPVGHIGLYRNPTTTYPVEYLVKLPNLNDRTVILCDPMLATGHSLSYAIDIIKKKGNNNTTVRVLCLVAAPEGVQYVEKQHPEVPIFTASLDEKLNDHSYIVPGLGDAGDRLFATK